VANLPELLRRTAVLVAQSMRALAQAQETIDVAKITCDQYLAGRVTDSRTLFVCLSGYYNGTRNDTRLYPH
jgi:hypothetical protein